MLPIITKYDKFIKDDIIIFKGYNASENKTPGEMPDMLNLCSDEYPCLSPRPPRELVATLTTPKALFAINDKLVYVDGTDFKYDGVTKGTVTASKKCMVDFQGVVLIFPDKKYYNPSTNTFGNISNGLAYPAEGSCPDMDFVTTLNNRVWGCKDNHIYASALGNFQNWTSLGTATTDSFAVDVASEGKFTGIFAFDNHVEFFKADVLHELYGDKPANFQVQEVLKQGSLSHDAVQEVQGALYTLWRNGVNIYVGGQPILISRELNKDYVSGVAGTDGRKYYLSLYDGSEYYLFVFDPVLKMWHLEDNLNVIQFARMGGSLYALCADGKLYKFNSGNEKVHWKAYSQVFHEYYSGKKIYSELAFRVDLESGSSLAVYVKINNGEFQLVKSYTAQGLSSFTVPLRIQQADHFQIMLEGVGRGKVYQISRKFFVESD